MTPGEDHRTTGGTDRHALLAFVIPFLLLVPFCSKGFHIDDTHFVRMAQHIQSAPLDYFGYEIHWNGYVGRGFDTNYNPPGLGYVLAAAGAVVGWNEAPLHLLFAVFTGLTSLGVYRLGQRFTPQPLMAALVTALTPGFIVSGSTLMSDMPALGLYVWGLYLWVVGVDEDRARWMIAAAVVMAVCTVTKYFGITSAALALVYAILQRKRPGAWCAYLAIPVAVLLLYSLHTQAVYGRSHFLLAREFASTVRGYLDHSLFERVLTVIPYLGVMALPWMFFLASQPRKEGLHYGIGLFASVGIGAVAGLSETVQGFYGFEGAGAMMYTGLVGAGAFLGVVAIAVAVEDVVKRRDAASAVLALWLLGVVVYGIAVAPILGARVVLPALPALGLLLARRIAAPADEPGRRARALRATAWALAGILAVSVLVGDYIAAERDRQAAIHAAEFAKEFDGPLYYYGTWGFQYYVEELGAEPFVRIPRENGQATYPLQEGMLIVVPQMYGAISIPEDHAVVVADYAIEERWPVATWDAKSRAGFYGEFLGHLPFAFDEPREHRFLVYLVPAQE